MQTEPRIGECRRGTVSETAAERKHSAILLESGRPFVLKIAATKKRSAGKVGVNIDRNMHIEL